MSTDSARFVAPGTPGRSPGRDGMRAANLARLAVAAFAAPEPVSRAELAELTLISRPTVTRLADDLVRAGVLVEIEPARISGPGRPAIPLRPAPGRFAALGLQVDVRRLTARLIDLTGALLGEAVVKGDFSGSDPNAVLPQLGRLADRVLAKAGQRTVVGAGIALPGLVDRGARSLLRAPNLGWGEVPVGAILGAAGGPLAGVPLTVDNEANLAAVTAARTAPGRPGDLRDFLYLSGEVGIGGCVVVDGEPLRGRHGWAGEFGHVAVDGAGPVCRCGSTGCLEVYVGRPAVLERAGLAPAATSGELAAVLAAGGPRARALLDGTGQALAVALGGIVNVLDIPTVVLGGHLAILGEPLAADVRGRLASRVLHAAWVAPEVRVGVADPAAAATGAAYVELERLIRDPAGLTRARR